MVLQNGCLFSLTKKYFEWSPPWHFKAYILTCILTYILTFDRTFYLTSIPTLSLSGINYLASILTFYLAFSLTFSSGILSVRAQAQPTAIGTRAGAAHSVRSSRYEIRRRACTEVDKRSQGKGRSSVLWCRPPRRVRRGTLWSAACGGGPAGITLIQRLLFGSGGEHCDLELAAGEEGGRRKDEEGGPAGLGGPADKKINNPHLTGGELSNWMI